MDEKIYDTDKAVIRGHGNLVTLAQIPARLPPPDCGSHGLYHTLNCFPLSSFQPIIMLPRAINFYCETDYT